MRIGVLDSINLAYDELVRKTAVAKPLMRLLLPRIVAPAGTGQVANI